MQQDYCLYHEGDHVGTISAISRSYAVSAFARLNGTSGEGLTAVEAVRVRYPSRFDRPENYCPDCDSPADDEHHAGMSKSGVVHLVNQAKENTDA